MALEFKQPFPLQQPPTKLQGLVAGLTPTINTIPSNILEYQKLKKAHAIEMAKLDLEHKKLLAEHGTIAETAGLPGVEPTPPEATALQTQPLSKEQKLTRYGNLGLKALEEPQYIMVSPTGVQTPLPRGYKPFSEPQPRSQPGQIEDEKLKAKIAAEKPKALGSFNNTTHEFDNMINEANAIKNDPGLPYATGLATPLGSIGSTDARRVAARIDTLKAKTLLSVLESMKELSKNGASGFGQLSNIEGENIRNSVSTLDKYQKTADFKASLDRFINEMEQKKQTLQDTFISTYGGIPNKTTPKLHNAALEWANSNPNDSRAAAVRQKALLTIGGQ